MIATSGFREYVVSAVAGRLVFGAVVFLLVTPLLVIAAYDLTRPTHLDIGDCAQPDPPSWLVEACERNTDPWFGTQ